MKTIKTSEVPANSASAQTHSPVVCWKCGGNSGLDAGSKIFRGDTCKRCSADLRACKACHHYDSQHYNECRESQADRVVEKERANFCDFFELPAVSASHLNEGRPMPSKQDSLKAAAEALFRKKE